MIKISDLSYLENAPIAELILGSVGAEVTSYASATGDNTYTSATANTRAKTFKNGFGIAIGWGTADAIGDQTTAIVLVSGSGDLVFGKTTSSNGENSSSAKGFVLAIEFP